MILHEITAIKKSNDTQHLENILDVISQELDRYKDISRVELFNQCIDSRLKAVLLRYNEATEATSNYLIRRGSARVLKTLTRMQKQEDKDVLEAQKKKKNEEEIKYDN